MIYNSDIIIPALCPLQFKDVASAADQLHYPQAFTYVQKYGRTDTIHVQVGFNADPTSRSVTIRVFDAFTDAPILSGSTAITYTATPAQLSTGNWYMDFQIACSAFTGIQAVYFTISDTSGLLCDSWPIELGTWDDTVLITYHNSRNDYQTVFGTYSSTTAFSIRVEGGFVPDGDEDISEIEEFVNQMGEKRISYSMPQATERLVLGDSNGLPKWLRLKLMAIFCCDMIQIGQMQYSRSGGWSMETTGQKMRIMSIDLTTYINRMTQTITGGILITNEDDNSITDEIYTALIL